MSELKKIRVREAKARDIGLFKKLWQDGIEESDSGKGSTVFFEELFDQYVESGEGFILLVADKGVLIAGEAKTQFEAVGTIAQIWGIYVSKDFRGQGIELAMLNEAKSKLKSQGHATVALAIRPDQEIVEAVGEAGFRQLMSYYSYSEEVE